MKKHLRGVKHTLVTLLQAASNFISTDYTSAHTHTQGCSKISKLLLISKISQKEITAAEKGEEIDGVVEVEV